MAGYLSSMEIYVFARDQAYFQTLFFAGERAGDLGKIKTEEILYFPNMEGLLFNHVLTKSLRDGTSNIFSLRRYRLNVSLCPVTDLHRFMRYHENSNSSRLFVLIPIPPKICSAGII